MVPRGTAGLIFVAAAAGGTVDEVVERVAEAAGISGGEVREDVVTCVEHPVPLGLLARW